MAVDKLVDSTQLDADLTSVANAIRTKGGTSAPLAFPADFVSAINAISGGGGSGVQYKSGTYTPTQDYTSTGNRLITTLANIGFTPKKFIFRVADRADLAGVTNATLYSIYDADFNTRISMRYTNASNTTGVNGSANSWTNQTDRYLYCDGTNVYFRTITSNYILKADVDYTWEAFG